MEPHRSGAGGPARVGRATPYDDLLLEYTNPTPAALSCLPWGAQHSVLAPGVHTQAHRQASSSVYMVLAGAGWSVVEGQALPYWEPGDVFSIPAWTCHEHANRSQTEVAALFAFTDAPVIQALGLYREEVYTAHGGHQPFSQGFSWKRHAPAWLLEPGWSPALPGEGTGAGLTKWTSSRRCQARRPRSQPRAAMQRLATVKHALTELF